MKSYQTYNIREKQKNGGNHDRAKRFEKVSYHRRNGHYE